MKKSFFLRFLVDGLGRGAMLLLTILLARFFSVDQFGRLAFAISYVNIFLLFTANYRNYATTLRRLAQVLTFFQGKQKFTFANSPNVNPPPSGIAELSLAMDLLSLTFEQVNHLWGFLGTKQIPFAMYRGRLVVLSDDRVLEGGGRIQDIDVTSRDITA